MKIKIIRRNLPHGGVGHSKQRAKSRARILRWEQFGDVDGSERKPVWLKPREQGRLGPRHVGLIGHSKELNYSLRILRKETILSNLFLWNNTEIHFCGRNV